MTDNVYSELYKRLQKMGDGYVMREKYLIKQSENELENLLEDMYISVPYPDYSHNSLFNFEPNHSIAGDRFPCSSIDCRLKRINELSIFSSMYADHVNIVFPLNRHINALIDNQQIDREMLLDDLEVIAAYRPLAEAGIVQFQPNMAVCCNQCMKKIDYFRELFMNQYDKFLANKELDLLRRLDCHVALDEYGIPYVAVGPMLEYGIDEEIDLHFRSYIPDVVQRRIDSGQLTDRILPEGIRSLGFSDLLFNEVGTDIKYFCVENRQINYSYLTNRDIDFDILNYVGASESQVGNYQALNGLAHTLPSFEFSNVNRIIKLREHNQDIFDRYRKAITSALNEIGGINSQADSETLYHDIIEPEVEKIDNLVKDSRKNLLSDAVCVGCTFSLGALASSYTPSIPAWIVGGLTSVLSPSASIPDVWKRWSDQKELIQSNNYYFLWKIEHPSS